jgi:hypothetical protein
LNESVTIFDVLVFKVEVDMMAIYKLTVTFSALLKLIVLFNFHALKHFGSFIRHLNHKILSNLSASRQAKKPFFIWTRFLISFHIFREYQLGYRAEIICWLLIYMTFRLAYMQHFRYFRFEFRKIEGKCDDHGLM